MTRDEQGFATRAVHAGERGGDPDVRPSSTPIYASSSFYYDDPETLDAVFGGRKRGYVYSRHGNPTTSALEEAVASLEGGETAVAFGSGMAALHAALVVGGASAGAKVVAGRDLYGATRSLLTSLLASGGVASAFADATRVEAVEEAVRMHRPAVVLVETISNPLLRLVDLPAVARVAHAAGASLVVDNTFASPALCSPLRHGADMVVHSATKYLAGHGDSTGGVVVAPGRLRPKLEDVLRLAGAVLSPFEAWLTLRGIKTLPLRMRQHWVGANTVALRLLGHDAVSKVHYPGLPTHPQHGLAKRLFAPGAFGGVVSFELRGAGRGEVFSFMRSLELVLPATTLGDVHSLVLHPATSSHRALAAAERAQLGIGDGLVRLAVGIEDVDDVIADLERALRAMVEWSEPEAGVGR